MTHMGDAAAVQAARQGSLPDRVLGVLSDLFWCLRPMRMSILVLALGFFIMAVADQGPDALRLLEEDENWCPLFGGVLFWAVNTWYAARIVAELRFRPEPATGSPERRQWLLKWLPRVLGGGVFVAVAVALAKAEVRQGLILADLGMGAVFLMLVWKRRALARAIGLPMAHDAGSHVLSLGQARMATKLFIAAEMVLSFALFVAAVVAPVEIGRWLTPGAVYLFASASWIPLGTVLVVFGERYRLPVFSLVAVLAVVFSWWNDNHAIRTGPMPARAERLDIAQAYARWLDNWNRTHPGQPPRPVVVATYGGGIRAAYWTAMTLARLEERVPDLRDRLFAISGASGGAVGAVAWKALSLEGEVTPERVEAVLSQDYLGPAFATMFYPDLAQLFLPFATGLDDRTDTMERAWESSWPEQSAFRGAFLDLWPDAERPWPALFLNGTSVGDGSRVVTSNLRRPQWRPYPYRDFIEEFGPDLYAATAASNATRFPLLSSAGTFNVPGGVDQIVDGGYYDNSGADTAFNIISEMRNAGAGGHEIVAILISSDTDPPCPGLGEHERAVSACAVPQRAGDDFSSVLRGLLNTRGARTQEAANQLQWTVGEGHSAWIRLSDISPGCGATAPPLGWVMSEVSRRTMICKSQTAVEQAVRVITGLAL